METGFAYSLEEITPVGTQFTTSEDTVTTIAAQLEQNVNAWTERHRRWMTTAIRECGHHEMYFSKTRDVCVSCAAESGYVSLVEALELAYPDIARSEDNLMADVYMPTEELRWCGFFGGDPASPRFGVIDWNELYVAHGEDHKTALRNYENEGL